MTDPQKRKKTDRLKDSGTKQQTDKKAGRQKTERKTDRQT